MRPSDSTKRLNRHLLVQKYLPVHGEPVDCRQLRPSQRHASASLETGIKLAQFMGECLCVEKGNTRLPEFFFTAARHFSLLEFLVVSVSFDSSH